VLSIWNAIKQLFKPYKTPIALSKEGKKLIS
jgi:hypothetical protein